MNKPLATAVLASTLLSLVAAMPAQTGHVPGTTLLAKVTIVNKTTKCAWITLYGSTTLDYTWHKLQESYNRPQWLKPGETRVAPVGVEQIKVLAEVKQNADCSGPTIRETYDIRKIGWANVAMRTAILWPSSEGYNLWFQD